MINMEKIVIGAFCVGAAGILNNYQFLLNNKVGSSKRNFAIGLFCICCFILLMPFFYFSFEFDKENLKHNKFVLPLLIFSLFNWYDSDLSLKLKWTSRFFTILGVLMIGLVFIDL